jgi:putative glutamine transport system ATP-binding protein
MSIIEFRAVNKFFGDFQVLKDINFTVDEGEVVVVIRPSGSGKSTVLRCINGLEGITSGELIVDGMHVNDKKTDLNKVRPPPRSVSALTACSSPGARRGSCKPRRSTGRL